ncbi:MAG: hypothetical protein ACKOX6_18350 [Bdellovibrio sp.]
MREFENSVRWYSMEEFRRTFKVGDILRMMSGKTVLDVRVTAIGETRILYRLAVGVTVEKPATITAYHWLKLPARPSL